MGTLFLLCQNFLILFHISTFGTNISPIIFQFINRIENKIGLKRVQEEVGLLGQKIKQNESGNIGKNIREIRVAKGIGQTEAGSFIRFAGNTNNKRMSCEN